MPLHVVSLCARVPRRPPPLLHARPDSAPSTSTAPCARPTAHEPAVLPACQESKNEVALGKLRGAVEQ